MNDIDISSLPIEKQFEFHKISNQIDGCDDINEIKKMLRQTLFLYLGTRATVSKLAKFDFNTFPT